jgi:4-amino-4-deoxy-L-arabinose transferase-like glycosyltransferase
MSQLVLQVDSIRNDTSRIAARNWLLLGLLLALGATCRWWGYSSLGLTHFDEGPYAISGMWPWAPPEIRLYPKQVLYSPPLYFLLVSFSYWIYGAPADTPAIVVNLVFGTATIFLVWWIVRRWLGDDAALAGASLVAFSDYFVTNARVALTDTVFGFLFLLSLGLVAHASEKRSLVWSFVAGIAVGLAWNTKYHGWLPLLTALLVPAMAYVKLESPRFKQLLICWLIMCAVAVACYLPWAFYIQAQPGGYLALSKYQRTFLSIQWLPNLWRQIRMQIYLDGWLTRVAPAGAALFALLLHPERWKGHRWAIVALVTSLLAAGLFVGGVTVTAVAAIVSLPVLFRRAPYLLAGLVLLFLMTPLYHPYARLCLPLLLCASAAAGTAIARLASASLWWHRLSGARIAVAIGLSVAVILFSAIWVIPKKTVNTWMATDSGRRAVETMSQRLPTDSIVFVHGAPEIAFYFQTHGIKTIPIDSPIDRPENTRYFRQGLLRHFLVTSIYSRWEPKSRELLQSLDGSLPLKGAYPLQPSDVRLLDDFDPSGAYAFRSHPTSAYTLQLYDLDSWIATEFPNP